MAAPKIKPYVSAETKPNSSRFRKTIFLLPNMFTAGNMVLGILSITYAINDALTLSVAAETKVIPFVWPAKFIVFATLLDFMDGFVARATNTTSKFGQEFDSLSDLVSFGMAPAILIYLSVLRYQNGLGLFITILYVVCAAIRLARFNVQAQVEEKSHFMGLPSPAAAGIIASYVLLSRWPDFYEKGIVLNKVMGWYEENLNFVEFWGIPILTVIIALVMISTISYPSLKKFKLESIRPITLLFVVCVVFMLFKAFELTAFLLLTFYLFWGIFLAVTKKGVDRLRRPKTAA
jgi:CDP-diacylglycerol--serine O-phosphatidyltransferase